MLNTVIMYLKKCLLRCSESSVVTNFLFSKRLGNYEPLQHRIACVVQPSTFWVSLKYLRYDYSTYLYYLPCVGWVSNFPDKLKTFLTERLKNDVDLMHECVNKYKREHVSLFFYDYWLDNQDLAYTLFHQWKTTELGLSSVINIHTLMSFSKNASKNNLLDTLDEISRLAEWCLAHKEDNRIQITLINVDLTSLMTGDFFLRNIKFLRDYKNTLCYKYKATNEELLRRALQIKVTATYNLFELDSLEVRLKIYKQPESVLRVRLK